MKTNSATIKLFLIDGEASGLRTAEISNWTGKAIAGPKTQVNELLERDELSRPGVYFLVGTDPAKGTRLAYIGEAEIIKDRLRSHKGKEFWVQVIVFVSKDENLTKSHIRYLEGKLIEKAQEVGKVELANNQGSGSSLPESDRQDMEIFLEKIYQLMPVLGSDILLPPVRQEQKTEGEEVLYCKAKGAVSSGKRTATGFVIFQGSTAAKHDVPSLAAQNPLYANLRNELKADGILVDKGDFLEFTKDYEFSSPSGAGVAVTGRQTNGLTSWKTKSGKTLKEIEQE